MYFVKDKMTDPGYSSYPRLSWTWMDVGKVVQGRLWIVELDLVGFRGGFVYELRLFGFPGGVLGGVLSNGIVGIAVRCVAVGSCWRGVPTFG